LLNYENFKQLSDSARKYGCFDKKAVLSHIPGPNSNYLHYIKYLEKSQPPVGFEPKRGHFISVCH